MILCHCMAVSDSRIQELAQHGCAAEDIKKACGAGTCCGSCRDSVERFFHELDRQQKADVERVA